MVYVEGIFQEEEKGGIRDISGPWGTVLKVLDSCFDFIMSKFSPRARSSKGATANAVETAQKSSKQIPISQWSLRHIPFPPSLLSSSSGAARVSGAAWVSSLLVEALVHAGKTLWGDVVGCLFPSSSRSRSAGGGKGSP